MFVKWRTVVFQGQEYRTKGLWVYRGAVEKGGKRRWQAGLSAGAAVECRNTHNLGRLCAIVC